VAIAQVFSVASSATSSAGPKPAANSRTPSGVVANVPAWLTTPAFPDRHLSEITEQDRPAHPASLPAPLSRTVAPYASHPPTERRGSGGTGSADIFTPVTNAIESINARYRRAVKARGHFPTEQAALQRLYLVTRSLDPTGTGRTRWAMRWKPALNAFAITFGDRFPAAETY